MQSQAKYLLSQTSNKAFLVNWAFIFCLSCPTLHTILMWPQVDSEQGLLHRKAGRCLKISGRNACKI